jgi:transcription-repair coupling factor (superfamily II helicase)
MNEIEKIKTEIEDRYGPLPSSAENLLRYGIVKYLAHKIKINSISRVGKKIIFKFYPSSSANLIRMTKLMERYSGSITPQGVMTLSLQAENETEIMIATISFLKELSSYNIMNVDSS